MGVAAAEEQVQAVFCGQVDRVAVGVADRAGGVGRHALLRAERADVLGAHRDPVVHVRAGVPGVEHGDAPVGQHDQAGGGVVVGLEGGVQGGVGHTAVPASWETTSMSPVEVT